LFPGQKGRLKLIDQRPQLKQYFIHETLPH
jgi:hypothetical protein